MELVKSNNVAAFSNLPMYKRMLKKVDVDLKLSGAIEYFYILTEATRCDSSAIMLEEKSYLSCTDADYEIVYKSARSFVCLENGDKIIEVTAISFNEGYGDIEECRNQWERDKVELKFSNILNAQMWDGSDLLDDIRNYLDKLYELGYRLVKNEKLKDNVKVFHLNLNDVVVVVMIDYNTITSIVEMFEMTSSDNE